MSLSARIQQIEESPTQAVTARAAALRAAGEPVIGFGAGEPDFPTPDNIVQAAQRAAADRVNHRYTAGAGLPALREAVAERSARQHGVSVDPAQVVITNGGKHALYNVFMTLVDPGDEVLIPAPYWVSYPEQVRLAGGTPIPVATGVDTGFRASVDQLEAARTERTKALVFVSPSNPTGAMYSPEQIAAIGRWAADNDVWVISDDIYSELVYGEVAYTPVAAAAPEVRDRLVVVDGVSKAYAMPGWRIGWSITPPQVAAGINRLQSHLTSNVCNVAQAAALEALTGPQDAVTRMREAFDRRRRLAFDRLHGVAGIEVAKPAGAFYIFPSFAGVLGGAVAGRRVSTSLELAAVLLDEAKVAVVPGEAFGAPGYARISYALGDDDLAEGLDRIIAALMH